MDRRAARNRYLVLALLLSLMAAAAYSRWRRLHAVPLPMLPAAFSQAMPQRVVWAWEEPEDLRTLPVSVGVAYLAETLLLGADVGVMPRRQPLQTADGAAVMAVVRIETRKGFADTPALRAEVARKLLAVVQQRPTRALQIDFDATSSQREFYAGVLQVLKPQLPADLPLSITALVSWCGTDSWLHGLPVDEAVPMFFRMGGPRRLADASVTSYRLVEPLCRTSVGLSTDERWPPQIVNSQGGEASQPAAPRIYLFAPQPWQPQQLAAVAGSSLSSLAQELSR